MTSGLSDGRDAIEPNMAGIMAHEQSFLVSTPKSSNNWAMELFLKQPKPKPWAVMVSEDGMTKERFFDVSRFSKGWSWLTSLELMFVPASTIEFDDWGEQTVIRYKRLRGVTYILDVKVYCSSGQLQAPYAFDSELQSKAAAQAVAIGRKAGRSIHWHSMMPDRIQPLIKKRSQ